MDIKLSISTKIKELYQGKHCACCDSPVNLNPESVSMNSWAIWAECFCGSTHVVPLTELKEGDYQCIVTDTVSGK